MPKRGSYVAIIDYGLGNLLSVRQACAYAGVDAAITSSPAEIMGAGAVIVPGVGAFGHAMDALIRLDLVAVLREVAVSGTPLVGICLGAQLLLNESEEFGKHQGLGIIPGRVVHLGAPREGSRPLKVPHVGWQRIHSVRGTDSDDPWRETLLRDLPDGAFMYFVHSFILQPAEPAVAISVTRYGNIDFCSSLAKGNVIGFQFHPERSGPRGLQIYAQLAGRIRASDSF